MNIKLILFAISLLFAQKSFALSKGIYECTRSDGAIKIQLNLYADDGHNEYLVAEAYWGKDNIFYGNRIRVRNGILTARNSDRSKKYVFHFLKLTLEESHARNNGPLKIYTKPTHYSCVEKK